MTRKLTERAVVKSCREYYDKGRLAAQCPALRKMKDCKLAYENDPVRFGYYRCAIGAAVPFKALRISCVGFGTQYLNAKAATSVSVTNIQARHDGWLMGANSKRDFERALIKAEKQVGLR